MRAALDIKRDHRELVERCLTLLSPDGTLMFSTNARGLTLPAGDFPGFAFKDIGPQLADDDFKGKRIPACYVLTNG
jgi:23S rRNA G2069 N7-methylase RlmK/C1962 C5-methylase RlmI